MGWTEYNAKHYKNGSGKNRYKQVVDRKAECDAYFMEGLNEGWYRVEKSVVIGSVYYAAVTKLKKYGGEGNPPIDIPFDEQKTFASVFLTSVKNNDYYNFAYKDMDESMMPYYFDCPMSILNLLSPTDNERCNEWRAACRERHEQKKSKTSVSKLPIGSVIEFDYNDYNGERIQIEKMPPRYQFKTAWWYIISGKHAGCYYSKRRIPDKFTIIKIGG